MIAAVVPMKPLAAAKGRLAAALSDEARAGLAAAMLADVLETLARCPGIARHFVISADPAVSDIARKCGADTIAEPEPAGLNAALRQAAAHVAGLGFARMLYVPGDVPLATTDQIAAILAAAPDGLGRVVVPAADGDGTNALLVSPAEGFAPSFGPGSFARHRDAGGDVRVLTLEGLGHDIDTPEDLTLLRARRPDDPRYAAPPRATGRTAAPDAALHAAESGRRPSRDEVLALAACEETGRMAALAGALALEGHGPRVSFSKKVFIPLTRLCRDVCHYCTFAAPPRKGEAAYLSRDEVLDIARAGAKAGCKEALFTLGDQPELRYGAAREALAELGHETTLAYLEEVAALVLEETGLLPHLNPGVMDRVWIERLRDVSVSQGLMLESASPRLCERGGPHFGSPDKDPAKRLATIEAAGAAAVPFTSGILIGIGETRLERIESLLALRDLHDRNGHIQEIIIQNFRAKPGTRMSQAPEPGLDDHVWTIAAARLLFGPEMNIQAPPNLRPEALEALLGAGLNDWGGVSPVTPDHVNPEAPWPALEALERATARAGRVLVERLAVYPAYAREAGRWLAAPLRPPVLRLSDADGLAREDAWEAGGTAAPPVRRAAAPLPGSTVAAVLDKAGSGEPLGEADIVTLFGARGPDLDAVCATADWLRRRRVGDAVSYVVNRNINYTNVCTYGCRFCAFSKGRLSQGWRDAPYVLGHDEVARRAREAWQRGATEVCLQGGIRSDYTGHTYLDIVAAVRDAAPGLHIHAFSPLEVRHGAETLGLTLSAYLARLKETGLASLPGTAAEILDDEVRAVLCADKLSTAQWLEVMETAHG
ncbi:MAG: 7,8-didemethyl-8-hydroxy-5-deazariboflavin synthase CofG, partial [Methyloligellaceae bacterium]